MATKFPRVVREWYPGECTSDVPGGKDAVPFISIRADADLAVRIRRIFLRSCQ